MAAPPKHKIITHPAPAKKVISSQETENFTLDVQQPSGPIPAQQPVIDQLEAVDINGSPIHIGDTVDIYGCTVIGLRPDVDNRLNLLVIPLNNSIVTSDPSHPLTGQIDGKGILVSGYHCTVVLTPTSSGQERAAGIDTMLAKLAQRDANPPSPQQLPSNFLAPSLL